MAAIRQLFVLSFALLVLASSTSFTLRIHFCGSDVAAIGVFDKEATCAMQASLPACHQHTKPDCCHDAVLSHDGQDYPSQKFFALDQTIQVEVLQSAFVLLHQIIPIYEVTTSNRDREDPPLPCINRHALHQVFII
jgi:hypothetical protein